METWQISKEKQPVEVLKERGSLQVKETKLTKGI